jgi:hypothetical protein
MHTDKNIPNSEKKEWKTPEVKVLNIKEDTSWLVWIFKKEIGKGPGS